MIRAMMKMRTRRFGARARHRITVAEIEACSKVLFTVFTRYGDAIIAFKAISEFAATYGNKDYLLITSPQLFPYARRILGKAPVEIEALDKRRNPVKILMIMRRLGKEGFDMGFNPWSHGEESRFFITYAKMFSFFKGFTERPGQYNLYKRTREYLNLSEPLREGQGGNTFVVENKNKNKKILVSPFSSNHLKSLSADDLKRLIGLLETRYPGSKITIAGAEGMGLKGVATIMFGKDRSEGFLHALDGCDLFIGVDAGPLHIADIMGKPSVGIFGPTAPESVLDKDTGVQALRLRGLDGMFCDKKDCKDPVCIHALFEHDAFDLVAAFDFGREIRLEEKKCPL
ncbi:MAG: glycosyltransferase family 9 protein [Deltaproteobacteria bacterium]|nr:glycosyltransferase family 9 protein [Deltaproteobacteria bacterium]